jgi:hypothetical protein
MLVIVGAIALPFFVVYYHLVINKMLVDIPTVKPKLCYNVALRSDADDIVKQDLAPKIIGAINSTPGNIKADSYYKGWLHVKSSNSFFTGQDKSNGTVSCSAQFNATFGNPSDQAKLLSGTTIANYKIVRLNKGQYMVLMGDSGARQLFQQINN